MASLHKGERTHTLWCQGVSLLGLRVAFCVCLLALSACSSAPSRPTVSERGLSQPLKNPAYHTVKAGDTLYSISLRYDVDYRDLAQWNRLPSSYLIHPRQRLRLSAPPGFVAQAAPVPAPIPAPAPKAEIATVRPVVTKPTTSPKIIAKETKKTEKNASVPAKSTTVQTSVKPVVAQVTAKTDATVPLVKPSAQTDNKTAVSTPPAVVKNQPSVGKQNSNTESVTAVSAGIRWAWPASGVLLARFSDSGVGNKGLDIAGRHGDSVRAAAEGTVVYAGAGLVGYGKLLIVRHDNNFLSVYAHNDRFLVKEGDNVKLGQEIAEMGSSGADRSKLRFEIRRQGKPVDPMQYLPPR